jgi:hypothetical protein
MQNEDHRNFKRDLKANYHIADYKTHIRYYKRIKRDGKVYTIPHHFAPDWMFSAMAVLDMVPQNENGYSVINGFDSKYSQSSGGYYVLYAENNTP